MRDENVSFPRRDTGSDLRVKKVRFCDVEPMQAPFSPAQKRIYDKGKKRIPCDEFPAAAHMVCDKRQQITSESNTKASKQIRRAQLDIESGDEGIEDFGFGSESDEEATAVLPEKPTLSLSCLMNQCSESPCANLCNVECNSSPGLRTNSHNDEFGKISIMIDSGASETVASEERFPSYDLV